MKPIGKRVLIKPSEKESEEREKAKKAGLILQEDPTIKPKMYGEVVAVGQEVVYLKKGDNIIFSPFHYEDVEEDLIITDETDVWAIIS